jgi:hypothetical protein
MGRIGVRPDGRTANADTGYVYPKINAAGGTPTLVSSYSPNPCGPINVAQNGTGSYNVTFANSGIGPNRECWRTPKPRR